MEPSATPLTGARPQGPHSVSVWGGKGGIGKTTDAFEAAYMLGLVGPTLLINADKKQVEGGCDELYKALASTLEAENPPRRPHFDYTETESAADLASIRKLKQYRFVVTDHAPYRDEAKLKEAAQSDLTIVPIPPRRLDSKSVMGSVAKYLAGTKYRIHLTMVRHVDKSRAAAMKRSLEDLGLPVFRGWMRVYNAHEMLNGRPIFHNAATDEQAAKAAADAYLFGDEILRHLGEPYEVPKFEGWKGYEAYAR